MNNNKKEHVDVVIIGFGWTGAIMAQELSNEGLSIVALERGPNRTTADSAKYPNVADELKYSVRGELFQPLAKETLTVRHNPAQIAVPYRQHGSFYLGNGVGGAGFHWNGMQWRAHEFDLSIRSSIIEQHGEGFIPQGMTIQDFGVSYQELEPYFTKFEAVCGVSGTAGNVAGKLNPDGNVLEEPRSGEYPLPPLQDNYGSKLFADAAREVGYHPFPIPAANASQAYTNPYGMRLAPCNFCGYCENYGCYMYSKATPQTAIIPALMHYDKFELRTQSHVIKINLDNSGKQATGVTYIDPEGREVEQTADLVILSAYQMHNVRLLLLSNIGEPYNPDTKEGVVGKNYCYQSGGIGGSVNFVLKEGSHLNPFAGAGAGGQAIDDFNADNFDYASAGFIGGATIWHMRSGGRPIMQAPSLPDSPNWGVGWKEGIAEGYRRVSSLGVHGSVMAYEDAYLDLDPTYKDSNGQPLLRMTFDWHPNEINKVNFMNTQAEEIAKTMANVVDVRKSHMASNAHYDIRPYQTTHNTGGAIMGESRQNSVVNKYLQSWDVHNLFVTGASAFPQNFGYNPTGLLGALAYWSVDHIRSVYLPNPGPMIDA